MTIKRGIRSAAFAAAVLVVIVLIGCGGGRNPNPNGEMGTLFRSGEYVGVNTCITCHEEVYTKWQATRHSHSTQTLADRGMADNARCLGCMSTGAGQPTGFVSLEQTPGLAGVQCETCHGPAGGHVRLQTGGRLRNDEGDILVSLSSDVCGQCHVGTHHQTFTEWERSAHAGSREHARNDSCLTCMSADGFLASLRGEEVTLEESENDITCVACHDPHDEMHEGQVRMEPAELCGLCHNAHGAEPGDTPRHPHLEVLEGVIGVDGGANSAHSQIPDLCVGCHRYTREFIDDENPALSGHEFLIDFHICQECHAGTAEEIEAYTEERQAEVEARVTAIRARLDALPEDIQAMQEWIEADFNCMVVENEGSMGVHNGTYTDSLLDAAEARLDYLESL